MKIYLAASYHRRLEMVGYAQQLTEAGHSTTSVWITGAHEGWPEARCAEDDMRGIDYADCVISFSEPPEADASRKRGGRHVEFGYAVAHSKFIVLVGPRENVFHHLSEVYQYDTFEEALTELPINLDE